jgi:hypothetical protein
MAVEKEWPNRATGEKYAKAYIRITDIEFSDLSTNQRANGFVSFTAYASLEAYKTNRAPIGKFRVRLTHERQYKKDKGKYVDKDGNILSDSQDDVNRRILLVPSVQDILSTNLPGTVNDSLRATIYTSLKNVNELVGGRAI